MRYRPTAITRPIRLAAWAGSLALLFPALAHLQRAAPVRAGTLAAGNGPDLSVPPQRWAEVAAHNEEAIVNYDARFSLHYRVRKVDAKGVAVREVVESDQGGSVARLVERDGRPLTPAEDQAERARLQEMLDTPDATLRRLRREQASRSYAVAVLRSLPKSMLWTYVPGQPQIPGAPGPAVVLDFIPDPAFKPPSLVTEGLTGIAGRVWIDAASQCTMRIQGHTIHAIDFGWGGVLARVKEGGYGEWEQRKAGDHRWLYSHLVERVAVREVLVHTVEENSELTASAIEPLPAPLSPREAVQRLLALPVPTR